MQLGLRWWFTRRRSILLEGLKSELDYKWIQEGDEGSKFFFDFLKRKVVADRFLVYAERMGLLRRTQQEIQGMFSDHFQNIFSDYHLSSQLWLLGMLAT
jgi:hypothetical protein